ncbi:hypothetical protein KIPB_008122, partial [Kipferlia bialata]
SLAPLCSGQSLWYCSRNSIHTTCGAMALTQWYDRCVTALSEITRVNEKRVGSEIVTIGHNTAVLTYFSPFEGRYVWKLLTLNDDHSLCESPFPVPGPLSTRFRPALVYVRDALVVCGTWKSDGNWCIGVYIYFPSEDSWGSVPLPGGLHPRREPCLFSCGESRVVLAGGHDAHYVEVYDAWQLDIAIMEWRELYNSTYVSLPSAASYLSYGDRCVFPGFVGCIISVQHNTLQVEYEGWTNTSRWERDPGTVLACIGDGTQRLLLTYNHLPSGREECQREEVYLYDVVSGDLRLCEPLPSRMGTPVSVTGAMINPTTAVFIGETQAVVLDVLPGVLNPDCNYYAEI